MVDGVPVCGGTLITNSWVLTASSCVDESTLESRVTVGFGMDSRNFEQVRGVSEISRFAGNDIELMLVGVREPFVLNGRTSGHHIPLHIQPYGFPGEHRCVGWDLTPDVASPTHRLESEKLSAIWLSPALNHVWWVNTDLDDRLHGHLLTSNDVGSGCFRHINEVPYLTAVHAANPAFTHDGRDNDNEEAVSYSVAASNVEQWVDGVLYGIAPETEWVLAGHAAVCSFDPNTAELFGLAADGRMSWRRQTGWSSPSMDAPWREEPSLDPPPGLALSTDRPGVSCAADGSIELLVLAVDGTVWWQHRENSSWAPEWQRLEGAFATSGLSVVGSAPDRFHVFARGPVYELRHAQFRDGEWIEAWTNRGGYLDGAPSARMANESWIDCYVSRSDGIWDWYRYFGNEAFGNVASDNSDPNPATVSWADERVDIFVRNDRDMLRRYFFLVGAGGGTVDANITLPPGRLTALAREPGRFEVFVTSPGQPVWHAVWPRDPMP